MRHHGACQRTMLRKFPESHDEESNPGSYSIPQTPASSPLSMVGSLGYMDRPIIRGYGEKRVILPGRALVDRVEVIVADEGGEDLGELILARFCPGQDA